MSLPYIHEPFTDFTKEENQKAFQEALVYVNSQLRKEYPLVIGGERITTDKKSVSIIRKPVLFHSQVPVQ